MNNEMIKPNKMGVAPIPKLLATMALPAIFSMLVQSMYNIVDSMFVARVSQASLDAVTIAFPMQMLVLAIALGIGIGTNSIVARRLGERRKEDADTFAQTGLFLAIIASVFALILGLVVPQFFMRLFTDNAEIRAMGTSYLMICMCCSFGMMIEIAISKSLQATGNMMIPMISQLIGAIVNIILDPIFIFTLKLGVTGAAVATVIGQICSMIFVIIMAGKRLHVIHIFFHKFRPSMKHITTIFKVGLPALVMNAVAGFVTIFMNMILKSYSADAITVLGVYFKVQSFIFMPIFGLTQGALPIMAYNYGANNKKRFQQTLVLSLIVSLVIMVAGLLIFQLAPEFIMGIFKAEGNLLNIGVVAMRIISWCFIPAALGIVATTACQSIGYGMTSLIMSLLRQVILILPIAYLFGKLWGLDAVWISYPFAEVITALIFTPLMFIFYNKAFKKKSLLFKLNPELSDTISQEDINNKAE